MRTARSPRRPRGRRSRSVRTGTLSIPAASVSNQLLLVWRSTMSKRSPRWFHGRRCQELAWWPRTSTTRGRLIDCRPGGSPSSHTFRRTIGSHASAARSAGAACAASAGRDDRRAGHHRLVADLLDLEALVGEQQPVGLARERPAVRVVVPDPALGVRRGGEHAPARAEHAAHLAHERDRVGDVLEHVLERRRASKLASSNGSGSSALAWTHVAPAACARGDGLRPTRRRPCSARSARPARRCRSPRRAAGRSGGSAASRRGSSPVPRASRRSPTGREPSLPRWRPAFARRAQCAFPRPRAIRGSGDLSSRARSGPRA